MIGGGARITTERAVNWHRQLRVTPISARTYFSAKALTSYALACLSIATLYAAGASMGVHLSAVEWLELTGYVLVALVPFAVFGIVLGHVLTVDSIGPAVGGLASLFALLGGAWGPLATGGALGSIVKFLPSYWLVRAGNTVVGGGPWPAKAWLVIAVWTIVGIRIAARVYQRDTHRV
jgi:ABC-2 type transport system permease protein